MSGEVEFFGQPRMHPPDEACRSFAAAFGITEGQAREHLEAGTAAMLIETRQSWSCLSCGGGLMHATQWCRCGRARPGESKRTKPMPWEATDPVEALGEIRRRYVVPL